MNIGGLIVFPGLNLDYTDKFDEEGNTSPPLTAALKAELTKASNRWSNQLEHNIIELRRNFIYEADEVIQGVWIGNYAEANDPKFIRSNNISVVLNMAKEVNDRHVVPGVKLIKVGMDDGVMANPGLFDKAADVISNAVASKSPVLVHCAAGISRSSTAVIAYLMQHKGFGWRAALKVLKRSRPMVNPHPKLMKTLMRDLGKSFKV